MKKGVLKNYAKFTGKDMRRNLFFNKSCRPGPVTLSKKKVRCRRFPMNFAKFLTTPAFFIEHLQWLLLHYFQGLLILYVPRIRMRF